MVFLQGYVFVWSINPEVFCRWFSFKVMSLCGALAQMCSVDGPPSKLCLCAEHFEGRPTTEHLWATVPHTNITEGGPSTEHLWANTTHKDIT
jgi:hypothetical protein